MKPLSSSFTFFYKYIVILIWGGGVGWLTLNVFFSGAHPDSARIRYAVIWLVGLIFIYAVTGSIKRVHLEKGKLYVSNYIRSERTDVADIASVSGTAFLSPALVWFKLKKPSPFGSTIIFMPRHRFNKGLGKHPMVSELEEELGL